MSVEQRVEELKRNRKKALDASLERAKDDKVLQLIKAELLAIIQKDCPSSDDVYRAGVLFRAYTDFYFAVHRP